MVLMLLYAKNVLLLYFVFHIAYTTKYNYGRDVDGYCVDWQNN